LRVLVVEIERENRVDLEFLMNGEKVSMRVVMLEADWGDL
jgi:hypothetical protein